jgi:stearoyl-CoA desaturase (delta-9 desaturase)
VLLKQFYTDRHMQLRSTALNVLASVIFFCGLYWLHSSDFYRFNFSWWYIALMPLAIYLGGLSVVCIHNATHKSFGHRWRNLAFGHLAGSHQLWGFKGWKLMHLIHHQYAENEERDPHWHGDISFWRFCCIMPFRANTVIRKRYHEHWGGEQKTLWLQSRPFTLFTGVSLIASNILCWYMLLGPGLFIFLYLPSFAAMYLLVVDINYSTHPCDPLTGETKPTNFNTTLFHRMANALWFGIYFHANHHRKPLLFNPGKMAVS